MIAVATSALAAILFEEPDSERYLIALFASQRTVIGTPTALELRTVLTRRKGDAFADLGDSLLRRSRIEVVSWTAEHLLLAKDALRRFGGRPASLNFGDCMAYAIAKAFDAPLLYKGEDFARTDVRPVL